MEKRLDETRPTASALRTQGAKPCYTSVSNEELQGAKPSTYQKGYKYPGPISAASNAGGQATPPGRSSTQLCNSSFVLMEIDAQYSDIADFCQQYGYDLSHSANTIIVASKREPTAHCAGIVGRATGWM